MYWIYIEKDVSPEKEKENTDRVGIQTTSEKRRKPNLSIYNKYWKSILDVSWDVSENGMKK